MITFALPGFEPLLSAAVSVRSRLPIERFPNGELTLRLKSEVEGESCVVIGSVAPPDEQLLALLLTADTLERHGVTAITALLPYLGYARQDKLKRGRSLGIAWLGRLLSSCGIGHVVTIDVHSPHVAGLLELPLRSLSPASVFAAELNEAELLDAALVAPDEGALQRCQSVAEAAGIEAPVSYLRKRRTSAGVAHGEVVGPLNARAVIVDDILDTGQTLVSCCRELQRRGVEDITVMVTHGLFTGEAWKKLRTLGVSRIYTTDTVPSATRAASEGVRLLSVRPLIEGLQPV